MERLHETGKGIGLEFGGCRVEIIVGDITKQKVDAIVNAANSGLRGGGGVDGAIHRAGGPSIMEECRRIKGGCPVGQAVVTTAGKLPAKYVIHTVGPVWKGGTSGEPDLLASCYRCSLDLALAKGAESVAFPAISTGVYGYPKELAARVVLDTLKTYLEEKKQPPLIILVMFSEADFEVYYRECKERAWIE